VEYPFKELKHLKRQMTKLNKQNGTVHLCWC